MRNLSKHLLFAATLLSLTILTIQTAEAANIPPSATAPPTPDQAMNFTAPEVGATFTILTPTTFTGAITNAGTGIGTLILNAGTQLNGAVATGVSPLLQVTLIGDATIIGATSAGVFNLGQNTLTNTGALNLPSGLVLNTRVVSDALFGRINASGANSIAGASVQVNVDASGVLSLTGAPLFIISAAGVTTGLPVNVTSNSVLWSFTGLNLNGNIEIFPTFIPPAAVITNPGASSVAAVLTGLIAIAAANPGSDLATVVSALVALPTAAELTSALLQIAPASGLVGVSQEGFNTTKQFQKVWLQNLYRYRERCLFQNMDNCCNPCQAPCCETEEDPCKVDNCGPVKCCNPYVACEGPRLWASGFGYHGRQDRKDFLNGYQANTYGTTLGFDAPVTAGLRAGIGGGYAFTDLDESQFGNGTDIHNYEGTVYFSYNTYAWFLDGGFSFGWNHYDGTRHIRYTGVDRTARAKYDGQEYTGFAAAGFQKFYNCFEIIPLATLTCSYQHIDDYTEKGADSLNLHIDDQDYTYVESGLGLQIGYLYQTCYGLYIPEVHSMWLHDFRLNKLNATSSFTGIGSGAGDFPNVGPGIDRNTWDIGASITCIATANFSILLDYDYNLSKSYYSHQGLLELSYSF